MGKQATRNNKAWKKLSGCMFFCYICLDKNNMYCDFNIPCSAQADRSAIDKLKLILSRLTQCK